MKILIVDDSKAMRGIVRRTLRQSGFGESPTSEAANGVEAINVVRADKPDLILCDWNMPEMSGLELLGKLRREGYAGKFGMVTSESSPEMRAKAQAAGALFLIAKPFTADSFQEVLGPLVRR